jgi:hypothetical protein
VRKGFKEKPTPCSSDITTYQRTLQEIAPFVKKELNLPENLIFPHKVLIMLGREGTTHKKEVRGG